jgi:hypothetical protein
MAGPKYLYSWMGSRSIYMILVRNPLVKCPVEGVRRTREKSCEDGRKVELVQDCVQ